MPSYLIQTIYTMAGYRTLQDIVSGYFAHHNWYCGEDHEDDLRATPLYLWWQVGFRAMSDQSEAVFRLKPRTGLQPCRCAINV